MTNPVVNLSIFAGAGAQFFDNNGLPLAGGLIYTYSSGTTTPQTTYTTVAATTQNSNPIVLDASGRTPQEIWLLNGYSYKFVLQTSVGTQIGSYDNIPSVSTNLPIINDASSVSYEQGNITTAGSFIVGGIYLITSIGTTNFITIGAGSNTVGVLFTATGVGSGTGTAQLATTVQAKLQEYVSVFDFMTATQISGVQAGTYTNDLSIQVQRAFDTGKTIFFPAGTYLFNVTTTTPFILTGEGTLNTFIKPYDYTKAIINYKFLGGQWSFNTIIRSVCFQGASGTSTTGGVGFTYGNTDPTVYDTNNDLMGFVTFENCRFLYLYKGIQRPSGNLALQITNCNFAGCYYGTYNIQGKGIPPGQFFLLNGETDSCLCGHYFDVQQEGLGQISFDNHVFEANSICVRIKQPTYANLYTPIMFRNCWNEANGLYRSGGPSTVTLDAWVNTGAAAVRTTEVVSCTYPYVMSLNQIEWNGGFCAGFSLASASNCLMKINNARVECTAGANSSPFYIDPADTQTCILMENCVTVAGFPQINNCIDYDRNRCIDIGLGATATRARFLQQMWNISTGTNQIGFNQTFQTAQTWSNGFGIVATGSVVTGNAIYSSVNNFAYTSPTGNQQYNFSNTQATVPAGYIVVTFQLFAVNLGSLNFDVWNAGVAPYVVAISNPIADSAWHTYGGIAYGNSPFTVNLGATSNDSTAQSINFSISAYQIKRFSTQVQAEDFLYSRTYLA